MQKISTSWDLKQTTFFKIPKDSIFEKLYDFEIKFVMGQKLSETNISSAPQLWSFQDQQLPSIWTNLHHENESIKALSLESRETCSGDSGLAPSFRKMSHKHRKLGLHLTRCMVGSQSKTWWKFALHASVLQSVFQ